jgi:hypothetical protein
VLVEPGAAGAGEVGVDKGLEDAEPDDAEPDQPRRLVIEEGGPSLVDYIKAVWWC